MSRPGTWDDPLRLLHADGASFQSPHAGALYALALAEGVRALRSFGGLDQDRARDLVGDLFTDEFERIVHADTPRAYFMTALMRRAISWRRRGASRVAEEPEHEVARETPDLSQERAAFVQDARDALEAESEKVRDILLAVGRGEDREDMAREFQTTRANIDQIVSRARKRFRAGDS